MLQIYIVYSLFVVPNFFPQTHTSVTFIDTNFHFIWFKYKAADIWHILQLKIYWNVDALGSTYSIFSELYWSE